jgi:hypothetical protein
VSKAGPQRPAAKAAHSGAGAWEQYIDTLEQAVLTVDGEVSKGRTPGWLGIKPPPGPVPAPLRVRCEMLLMLLDEVTRQTERRRSDLRAQLAAMPHPRPVDHARAASLGHTVDVIS